MKTRAKGKARRVPASPPPRKSRQRAGPAAPAIPTLRQEFDLTRKALARMTGLSERTLATWEAGAPVSEPAARAITAVERLLRALAEVAHKSAISGWLATPNEAFDGLKPVEVLERGQADRIWRMIYFLGSGTAS
jgi:transcriptional regulator with XRE-family HTH domain